MFMVPAAGKTAAAISSIQIQIPTIFVFIFFFLLSKHLLYQIEHSNQLSCTPRTKNRNMLPTADCVALYPSAQVTFTFMMVFPTPMIGISLIVAEAPSASEVIVPLFVFPRRIKPLVKVNVHWMFVAGRVPVFVMTALIPNPPVMLMLKMMVSFTLTVFVTLPVALPSSVTCTVTG